MTFRRDGVTVTLGAVGLSRTRRINRHRLDTSDLKNDQLILRTKILLGLPRQAVIVRTTAPGRFIYQPVTILADSFDIDVTDLHSVVREPISDHALEAGGVNFRPSGSHECSPSSLLARLGPVALVTSRPGGPDLFNPGPPDLLRLSLLSRQQARAIAPRARRRLSCRPQRLHASRRHGTCRAACRHKPTGAGHRCEIPASY